MTFMPLLHNITLLITLGILYGLVIRSWRKGTLFYCITTGILFSIFAVIGMMNAMVLAPGLIFDGRSIIISIASFLGGPITAAITTVTASAYRIWLGGNGMLMGVCVISESALIGLIFYYLKREHRWVKSNLGILLFGVLVHAVMLSMMYLLPGGLQAQAFNQVAVPVIIIYPLATVVLCLFFIAQEERVESDSRLKESEHKYKELVEGANSVILKWRPDGIITYMNRYGLDLFGFTENNLLGRHVIGTIVPEVESTGRDLSNMIDEIGKSIDGFVNNENENVCKDGSRLWIKWRNQFLWNDMGEVEEVMSVGIDVTEQKQAEEELKISKYYLEKAQEISKLGSWELDLRINELIWTDENYRVFGVPIGTPMNYELFLECVHPEDRDFVDRQWKAALVGEPYDIEHRLVVDGKVKWVREKAAIEVDDNGNCIRGIGFTQDITERKQAEQKLFESEKEYRALFNNAQVGLFRTRVSDGLFLKANHRVAEMFGYDSPAEMVGHLHVTALYIDPLARSNMLAELKENGALINHEALFRKKDGSVMWVRFSGKLHETEMYFEGVGVEITESKQADEELQRSKALLRKVLDTVPNYICAKDIDGKFLLVNTKLAQFYGTTVEEMTGMPHADICEDEEELKEMLAADREVIESGIPKIIPEEPMKHSDGSITYLETIKVPFAIFSIPAVLILSRDVTERKELEEERNKAAKLESIGLLAGGIAHDFNNILTAILGNVSLANILVEEDHKKTKSMLAEVEKSILSAKDLTRQLLTFSKGGEPIKKTIILSDLIREVTEFSLRGSNVKCSFDIADNLWPCKVDEGQIDQTIRNIIINADQAMSGGGTITIHARNMTLSPEDTLPLVEGRYVQLMIKDQGLGIPEKNLPKIFDPYFTTKQKGSGLGLATCYSIVKRHDGHIAVESERDIGTTFHIYLPASSDLVEVKVEKKADVSEIEGKILIMDDEPALIEVVSKILLQIGCDSRVASNGTEAVRLYKKAMNSSQPFNAVILDLTVPGGMGGQEAVTKLREIDPAVKAIVSSGYSNDPVLANYRDYGFCGMVSKPYDINELKKVLSDVMEMSDEGA